MIRTCRSCGKLNRIPPARLTENVCCGGCKEQLAPLAEPVDVDPDDFREIVNSVKIPVLVDFWADWCGPCRLAALDVQRVAQDLAGKAVVLKVDTEKHPELAALFQVQGIPNFAVLKDGNVILQHPGLADHRQMKQWLEDAAN